MNVIEEEPVVEESSEPAGVPDWLSGLEEEKKAQQSVVSESDDLPAWMRDDTGEVVAEPTKIEPTRSTDWTPVDEKKVEAVQPPPPAPKPAPTAKPEPKPEPKPAPAPKAKKPAPARKEEVKPATPPEPYKEPVTRRGTGMLTMPVDPVLGSARAELSRSNIPGALETYEKLIKKGRFLEETIYDLREALYRYPVEVSIWQTLGDAYMRANQLQDALDAYTKAEELLR
jgi:outer membrane biosynthesis protein TonB